MAVALAYRGAALAFMAGSDEGYKARSSTSRTQHSTPPQLRWLRRIPGILPGWIEKARRSAEAHGPGAAWTLFARRSRIAVHETSFERWVLPRYTPSHAKSCTNTVD